jgi:retinol-binding protein 3
MITTRMSSIAGGILITALVAAAVAQKSDAPATLDAKARSDVIDGAIDHMRRAYIFADVAEKMAVAVRERAANKEYDAVTAPREFADLLTRHLQDVSKDKHLRIVFNPEGLPQRGGPPSAEDRARNLADERRRNFGFQKVERLDGNVGYVDLLGFSGSPEVAEAAVPAMNFLANTDALIFDLRRNGGGSPVTIGLVSSYLFDKVVHLNDFYHRETDRLQQFFTTAEVQGRRYGAAKPVYVLTSNRTFSAAEEFTYNLKSLKRATIVGETTGGGAHPGGVRRITDHFGIWLPTGRAINPVTKTNWEGVGVAPDISVTAAQALEAAHLDALKKIRTAATDPRHQQQLDAAIAALEQKRTSSNR